MAKWKPCKRRDFIRKLKKLGFEPPEPGGRHFYMRCGTYTVTLPNNKEYSFSFVIPDPIGNPVVGSVFTGVTTFCETVNYFLLDKNEAVKL